MQIRRSATHDCHSEDAIGGRGISPHPGYEILRRPSGEGFPRTERETTRVTSSTLDVISHVTSHAVIGAASVAFAVGRLLALGTGVGLAAVAILRTRAAWMWVGWLGVVAAVPGGLYSTVVHGWTGRPPVNWY